MSVIPEYTTDFRAVGYAVRLYSGKDALENLPAEIKRARAKRVFIVCGRTVSRKTELVDRIQRILGENYAGRFDEIDKDTTLSSVSSAAAAAKAAQADLLIGVGAGSVTQGTRVVAILMAETRPVEQLITQYPENGAAISARLTEPKVPIINVLTAATSAQNRAGAAVKDPNRNHRMEFFDPKTRPVALFWDADALMTAPVSLARTTALSSFWRSTMNLGAPRIGPLAEGDRLQAYRLARFALERVTDPAHATDVTPRIASCAAAFLQNRDADDGSGNAGKHWVARVVYAFATALFQRHEEVGQGEATCALTPTVLRKLGMRDREAMALIAQGLGVWNDGDALDAAAENAACEFERVLQSVGAPTRISQLGIPRDSLSAILDNSMRNFNADPRREFIRERDFLGEVLQACW
jgi:alcohol dehydrogenase class IV